MKLSFKFFCIAYIIVLLSTGAGGIFLIKNAESVLWDSQTERVNTSENYALDSFLSFAEVSSGTIKESQISSITRQIKNILDSSITDLQIITSENADSDYSRLENNEGFSRFFREGNALYMESVCRLDVGSESYFIAVYSDFSEIEGYCAMLWRVYAIVVLVLAFVSGALLFVLAKRVTRPINRLTKAAKSIASGNYGETVKIKSKDREIQKLSQSFNTMSVTIKEKIREIKEESDKRNTFVADFTHEIKTPMTAIIGYSEMLNSYNLTPAETKQAARAIYKEGKRLEKLSLQLLDMYVFQNEKVAIEPLDLNAIVKQLETTLVFLARKYKMKYSVEFHGETVLANSVLLLSMLYNLSDNAFKASKPNSTIKIHSTQNNSKVKICICDNGKGIAPENIKLLTEPFFREDKARSRALGGAGLGLSICKEIAALHGTSLVFESELGVGTTVSFDLDLDGEDYV